MLLVPGPGTSSSSLSAAAGHCSFAAPNKQPLLTASKLEGKCRPGEAMSGEGSLNIKTMQLKGFHS